MTRDDDGAAPQGGAGKKDAVTKNAIQDAPTKGPAPDPARSRRRGLLLAVGAVVLIAAIVALVLALNRDNGSSNASAGSSTGTARDTSVIPNPPTPTPTGPTENVDSPPSAAAEVPLNSPAAVGNGVVASLTSIEAVQGTANGPGNVAGPAIRVTVHVENGTSAPMTLAGAAINMYYGADDSPASPLDDASARPFGIDMIQPGASADGVYVFTVPEDQRDKVTVEVGYEAGAPLLLFSGPVR
jgi:hypothetical protein